LDGGAVTGFLLRRIVQALIVTFFVSVVTLLLLHLFPGGPIRALLGPRASVEQVNYYNRLYGYNQPIYVQWWKWVGQIVHGNLGFSMKLNQSVTGAIMQRLPKTIILITIGTVVSLVFGIPLGIYQAVKRYTAGDYALTGVSFIGYATPPFFVGLLLINWFAIQLHIFPPFAPQGDTVADMLSQPNALVLPVVTLAFLEYALWSRFMRSSVMDNLVQDYVRTARAKGASERRVLWGHIFRNSLISIVTLLGLSIPALVGGAVIIESVFNFAGMGLLFYQAALNVDYPMLLGTTLVATAATIIGNLLADVGYAMLDPRVRYS